MQQNLLNMIAEKRAATVNVDFDYSQAALEKIPAQLCLTRSKLESFLAEAGDQRLGFDIETNSLWHGETVVGASLAFLYPSPKAIYIPFAHKSKPNSVEISFKSLVERIHQLPLVAFNATFELSWTYAKTGLLLNIVGDANILSKMLQDRYLSLKDLVEKTLGVKPLRLADILGEGHFDFSLTNPLDPKVLQYVTDDAINALLVETHLSQHKTIQKSLNIYHLELSVLPILAKAEAQGVYIDESKVEAQIKIFGKRVDELRLKIYSTLGCAPFPLHSTQQLAAQLFGVMKIIPSEKYKTKKGYSTSSDALAAIQDQHLVIKDILQFKHFWSVFNNNLTKIHEFIRDGLIYTNFLPVGADGTSRIYTKDANFTALPTEVRECMACEPDRSVVAYDFQAAELRIVAAFSGEEVLIEAFRRGIDPHKMVYSRMTGVPVDQMTKDQRDIGKVLNYANIYGGTPYSTARALNCTEEKAKEYRENYIAAIPKVQAWIKKTQEECAQTTYTKTMMGRRRRLPEVKSSNRYAVAQALRQSVNTACQSSCGDFLKVSMLQTFKAMQLEPEKWASTYLICPVFDSCAYSVPTPLVEDFKKLLQENAVIQMPIAGIKETLDMAIDIKVGSNWGFEQTIPEETITEG